jgi:hypothetical protein
MLPRLGRLGNLATDIRASQDTLVEHLHVSAENYGALEVVHALEVGVWSCDTGEGEGSTVLFIARLTCYMRRKYICPVAIAVAQRSACNIDTTHSYFCRSFDPIRSYRLRKCR